MHLKIFLFLTWLSLLTGVTAITMLPEESVQVQEGMDTIIRSVFGPNTITEDSELMVAFQVKEFEIYEVARGKENFRKDCRASIDRKAGIYSVYIQNASFEIHNGTFFFSVRNTETGESNFKQFIHLTVLQVPDKVVIKPRVVEVAEDQFVKFTCVSLKRFSGCTINWLKITKNETTSLNTGAIPAENCSSTVFFPVNFVDNGMRVQCEVTNANLTESPKSKIRAKVKVKFVPRVRIFPEGTIELVENSQLELTCLIESYPPPTKLQWVFENRVISRGNATLQLQAEPKISGLYICETYNEMGSSSSSAYVRVQHPPIITLVHDQELTEGQNFSTVCHSLAAPAAAFYVWQRKKDARFRVSGQNLVLYNVTKDDSDNYTCTSVNYINPSVGKPFVGKTEKSFQINVRHAPDNAKVIPNTVAELEGRVVEVTCTSEPAGYPIPTTRWIDLTSGKVLAEADVFMLKMEKNPIQVACLKENSVGTSFASSPVSIILLSVEDNLNKSTISTFNSRTGKLSFDAIDLAFPVMAKVEVLRKDSTVWEYTDVMFNASNSATVSKPDTVAEIRLLICGSEDRNCIRAEVIKNEDNKNLDIKRNPQMNENTDEEAGVPEPQTSITAVILMSFAVAIALLFILGLIIFLVYILDGYQALVTAAMSLFPSEPASQEESSDDGYSGINRFGKQFQMMSVFVENSFSNLLVLFAGNANSENSVDEAANSSALVALSSVNRKCEEVLV